MLRNAVSYSTPGGRVDIQAKTVGRQAEITIRNEGLEIPEGSWPTSSRSSTGWTPPALRTGGPGWAGHRQGDRGEPRREHPLREQRAAYQLRHLSAAL
ncbi:MAG: hypothetical protein ACLRIS_06500 [Flavonifractor plautii]